MRKIFTASIFIFAFCIFTFGQSVPKTDCPGISINISEISVSAGEETTFTANVDVSNVEKLKYDWSVERGIIVNGQGTNKITVQANSSDGIIAGVEIKGLPEGCQNWEADSTATVCGFILSREIDALDVLSDEITEERLNAWVAEIENEPSAQMYVIIYNNQKFPSKKFKDKIAYIQKNLSGRNIEEINNLFIYSEDKGDDKMNDKIRVFIVPKGATPPMP